LKRGDKVYTQIVNYCSAAELVPIIECNVDRESIIPRIVGVLMMI